MSALDTMPTTDDLNLLDDSRRHARCTVCTGTRGDLIGVPFVALCGQRAINLRSWDDPASAPPDACPACLVAWPLNCPNCGHR